HLGGPKDPVFTAYIRDISDRKRGGAALEQVVISLRESEERYRVLAEALPVAVWTKGADGRGEFVNQHWLQYSGLTAEEAHAGGWLKLLHPDDRARAVARWEARRGSAPPEEMEIRIRRASDGAYRWHLVRICPVRAPDGKGVAKWVGIAADIDDRRRAEE